MHLFFAHIGEPLTFEEIKELTGTRKATLDEILSGTSTQWQHRERSLRRALTKLVRRGDGWSPLLTIGKGRPGDPYRYHVNPALPAMFGDKDAFEKACAALGHPKATS